LLTGPAMSHHWKIFLLLLVGFLLLGAALFLAGFEQLTKNVVRPWIGAKFGEALSGTGELGGVEIHGRRVVLTDLRGWKAGEFRLLIPEIEIQYSWGGIISFRLDRVEIKNPQLHWEKTPGTVAGQTPEADSAGGQEEFPERPRFGVRELVISQGRITTVVDGNRFVVKSINFQGGIGPRFDIRVSALMGEEDTVPLGLEGHGVWEKRPEITLTDVTWSGRSLLKRPVTIAPGMDTFGAALGLDRIDDELVGHLLGAFQKAPPWPEDLHWQLSATTISLKLAGDSLSVVAETGEGQVRLPDRSFFWAGARVEAGNSAGRWATDGEVRFPRDATAKLSGTVTGRDFSLNCDLSLPDPAALAGDFGLDLPGPARDLSGVRLAGTLEGNPERFVFHSNTLSAVLTRGGRLGGSLRAGMENGEVFADFRKVVVGREGREGFLAATDLALRRGSKRAGWTGDWSLQVPSTGEIMQLLQIQVPGDFPEWKDLDIAGKLATGKKGIALPGIRIRGRLEGPGLEGTLSGRMAVTLDGGWRVDLTDGTFENLEYFSGDGTLGFSGGAVKLAGEVRGEGERTAFVLKGKISAREALAGPWYGALEGLPVGFSSRGEWVPGKNRGNIHGADLDLAGLGSAKLSGEFAPNKFHISGILALPDLTGRFADILRRLGSDLFPDLKELDLKGGLVVEGRLGMAGREWNARVNLKPDALAVRLGEGFSVSGLTGDVPLAFGRGGEEGAGPEEEGALSWKMLSAKLVDSGPVTLNVVSGRNRLRLVRPLVLPTAGGTVKVDGFHIGWSEAGLNLEIALLVDDLSLEKISSAFGWPPMAGNVTAEFKDIRYENDELSSGGEATVQVFGGTFLMRNLRVRKPFSRYPTYHADVDFSGVDLEKLTHTFEFGEVNGIADGHVHGLRLFDGVPSAFHARFETRSEGTRNISVKAIKNLNTLSQGGMSAALSKGIYRFIDFYRYRKIGILCWLENDVFHLKGTAREGSDQYLIYGSLLPPRIDVIVSTPTISFKEMVKRLQRIERTGG